MNMKVVELQPKIRKMNEESLTSVSQQFLGFDKTILMLLVVVGLCLAVSYFLFREVKKTKEEIRNIKNNEIDYDEITEKVENNSNSVKAMEMKIDQIIGVLQNNHSKPPVQQVHVHTPSQSEKKQIEHVQKVVQKAIVKKLEEEDDDESDGFEDSDDEKVIPSVGTTLKTPVEIRI